MITRRPLLSLASALAVWLLTPTAHAQPRLHLQGHAAIAVDGWQSEAFGPGGGAALTAEYALAPALGVTLGGAYTALSQGALSPNRGIAQPGAGGFGTLTAGLRLRPLARRDVGGEGLWLALEGGVGFTGDVARPAYAASLGYGFSVGSTVSLGPWVGFTSLVQTDGQDLRDDARLVLAGLSLSLGPASRAAPPPAPPPAPRCPTILGQALPDADGDGCAEPDRDGDAIADAQDRCPAEPEDRDGHEDTDGCPDPDNDADGIPDVRDRCPDEPEVVNGVDDTDGCPDVSEARVVRGRIILDERARFPYASSRVTPEARAALLAVARIMSTHPEYAVLSVEGHADERGGDAFNDGLSLQRARAALEQLVAAGVPRDRIRALGFGRRVPVASGADEATHAQNRRVDFVVDGHGARGVALTADGYVQVGDDGTLTRTEAP